MMKVKEVLVCLISYTYYEKHMYLLFNLYITRTKKRNWPTKNQIHIKHKTHPLSLFYTFLLVCTKDFVWHFKEKISSPYTNKTKKSSSAFSLWNVAYYMS